MAYFSTWATLAGLLALVGVARGQTFAAATFYPLGVGEVRAVAVADFNADGNPDVAVTSYNPGTVTLLMGTSTGNFQTGPAYSTGPNSNPMDMAVSDVNNDGYPDVVVANAGTSTVGVLLATSTGTLQAVTTFATGSRPFNLEMADVNADGKVDIVAAVTTATTNSVNVLLGNGNGTFQCCGYLSGNILIGDLAVGDVNADGKLDVVTVSSQGATSAVLLGTGTGAFQLPLTYTTNATGTGRVRLGDINADGKPDIAFESGNINKVGTLLGTGTGTFQSLVNYTVGVNAYPADVSLQDMNSDGRPDIVLTRQNPASLEVRLNDGSGAFPVGLTFPTAVAQYSPMHLVWSDVNRDGRLDAVMTAYYITSAPIYYMGVEVMLNTTPLPTRASLPGATATLAPNPAGAATTLLLGGLPAAVARVQATVLDATGREVARHLLPTRAGNGQAELPMAGLAPGLYVVRLLSYDAQDELVGELPALRLGVE